MTEADKVLSLLSPVDEARLLPRLSPEGLLRIDDAKTVFLKGAEEIVRRELAPAEAKKVGKYLNRQLKDLPAPRK